MIDVAEVSSGNGGSISRNANNLLNYPKSKDNFSPVYFKDPPSEYRGMPFWSWNTRLEKEELLRQIDVFQKMGMGGFYMHVRCGLDTPYMGPEFLDVVKACVDRAKSKGMLSCLYDEDRWPSGSAGGLVSKFDKEFRAHCLKLSRTHLEESDDVTFMGKYSIRLSSEGHMLSYKYEKTNSAASDSGADITWYAYFVANEGTPAYGGGTYGNLINPKAVDKFIEITHEKYYESLKDSFGSTIPSLFTDEPRSSYNGRKYDPFGEEDVMFAWYRDLPSRFESQYGYDILSILPELVWDKVNEASVPSKVRYHFYDHICEKLVSEYVDKVAKWCTDHGILLLGHADGEGALYDQVKKVGGEAMRFYRNQGMPGIDMLVDRFEYSTAKQAQSVSRQRGLKGVMCELFGVVGYEFKFEDFIGSGDWQAALGVTSRVPHLSWASMIGEAKRDYPPSINYQSTWWEKFKLIEDHFSRVTTVLTRGRPVTRVAMIHPIESYWLSRGPRATSYYQESFLEEAFEQITRLLVNHHIDFDYISESLLPSQCSLDSISSPDSFPVGRCDYEVIILPNLQTIRSSTLDRLKKFSSLGGKVIIAGETPRFTDVAPMSSADAALLASSAFSHVSFNKQRILETLESYRDVKVVITENADGITSGDIAEGILYQMRKEDLSEEQYLFMCNTNRKYAKPSRISIRGTWKATVLDTFEGERASAPLQCSYDGGQTIINYHFDPTESLLLHLEKGTVPKDQGNVKLAIMKNYKTHSTISVKKAELSENNVLILDYCKFKTDRDSQFRPQSEEVLKIDNICRKEYGLPIKEKSNRQPWTMDDEDRKPLGTVELLFEFESAANETLKDTKLAIEKRCGILNGKLDGVEFSVTQKKFSDYWVDRDITTVALPPIAKGKHTLLLTYEIGWLTNLERHYILGDFGVKARGRSAKIVDLELEDLEFGDIVRQNLPFYVGDINYICEINLDKPIDDAAILVPKFAGPVISVKVNGKFVGNIVSGPYMMRIGGDLVSGTNTVELYIYGHRGNSFGPIHLPEGKTNYHGPRAFRTEHDWWSEEYVLSRLGILQSPKLMVKGKEVYTISRAGQELVPYIS